VQCQHRLGDRSTLLRGLRIDDARGMPNSSRRKLCSCRDLISESDQEIYEQVEKVK
jgi:hypothetical protein